MLFACKQSHLGQTMQYISVLYCYETQLPTGADFSSDSLHDINCLSQATVRGNNDHRDIMMGQKAHDLPGLE